MKFDSMREREVARGLFGLVGFGGGEFSVLCGGFADDILPARHAALAH